MLFSRLLLQVLILSVLSMLSKAASEKGWKAEEEIPEYWKNLAKEEVDIALELQQHNLNVAKNVILFLGDGMNIPTVTAGRILKGQMQGESGEETILAMDRFSHVGLSKTYGVDAQVADSACTGTAFLCGVKAKYQTLGLSAAAVVSNCSSSKGNEVDSVLVDAHKADKSTGIVTTTHITHATPAAAYAHSASRSWYDDGDLPQEAVENGCKDIAQQFYEMSDKITVAMGGGRKYFQPKETFDPEYPKENNNREDGQDLIGKWLENQAANGLTASYVWNQTEFDNVDPVKTDRLLGLFEPSHMQYEADRQADPAGEPSLAEMTEKAIRILQKNSKGYFLLVEGGKIDHAHHGTNAYRALHDFVAFDEAVAKAVQMTSDSDTLIMVTADHSHTFTFAGYSDRGNPILDLAFQNGKYRLGSDGKPYTTLLYGNGEGFQGEGVNYNEPHTRQNLTSVSVDDKDYQQQSAVPLSSETHAGDDVAIMARGPMSHLIHGVHQQSYIAYVMRYASCVGEDTRHCEGGSIIPPPEISTTSITTLSTKTSEATPTSTSTSAVLPVATFLGLNLNSTEVAVALNVQFALLVVLFLFALVSCVFVLRRSPFKSASSFEMNGYENKPTSDRSSFYNTQA